MPRNNKLKQTAIPDVYLPDFVERLNKRERIGKAVRDRICALESDLGGSDSLSHARRSLIRRAVWLEALAEHDEQRLAAGETIDIGRHTQAVNALMGLFRTLGLERRLRPARSLRDVMNAGP